MYTWLTVYLVTTVEVFLVETKVLKKKHSEKFDLHREEILRKYSCIKLHDRCCRPLWQSGLCSRSDCGGSSFGNRRGVSYCAINKKHAHNWYQIKWINKVKNCDIYWHVRWFVRGNNCRRRLRRHCGHFCSCCCRCRTDCHQSKNS